MGPLEAYQQELKTNGFVDDPAQRLAVQQLQQLSDSLIKHRGTGSNPLTKLVRTILRVEHRPIQGLYFWGDVGRGKTWLMNLFHDSLQLDEKLRQHFHHFMQSVHEKLAQIEQQKDPLKVIAQDLADRYRVICLDEFIVTNITDAMLLSGLLDALFKNGVTLVATSNRVPDDLYKNGLQRERFLPAIDLIKQHTRVIHINGETDHRIALLEQHDTYYTPITENTENELAARMVSLAPGHITENSVITVLKRPIQTRMLADEIAWFDYNALCDAPRAAPDYIELARDYHTILLSNVPVMDESLDDKARRFIYLIDELYDRQVKLIISADASPEKLYTGKMLEFAFNRTSSRLIEMRSAEYLEKPHRNYNES